MNSYLAEGGDGFPAVRDGTSREGGPLDVEALEQYFAGRILHAGAPGERIKRVDR